MTTPPRTTPDRPDQSGLGPPLAGEVVTEHAVLMAGGGMHVRPPGPEVERVWPLVEWVHAQITVNGAKVYRRRVIVVDDWVEVAVTLVAPWWKGTVSDHIYETCPVLRRSEPELKRHGFYGAGRGELDPEGGDVCGWCLRVWRARTARNTTLS